jgi:hypothetical protein
MYSHVPSGWRRPMLANVPDIVEVKLVAYELPTVPRSNDAQ